MAPSKQSIGLEDVRISIDNNYVGGAQSAEISFNQENKVIMEGGTKKPREIKDGTITINGTLERLFLDIDTIKDLVDIQNGDNPYFNIVANTKNKDPERRIKIIDAKFKGFKLNFAMNEESKISQEFDALDINM